MKKRLTCIALAAMLLFTAMPVRAAESGPRLVTGYIYDDMKTASEGLLAVKLGKEWGYIDGTGRVVVSPQYDYCAQFSEGRAAVNQNGKWAFIDREGALLTEFAYDDVQTFSEGLCAVRQGGKWGYIDGSFSLVIPCQFDAANLFSEGLAAVMKGGKYAYIDANGAAATGYRYTAARGFSEGLAAVSGENGKWGYIDKTGKTVVPLEYELAYRFEGGRGVLEGRQNGQAIFAIADKSGRLTVDRLWQWMGMFSDGLAAVKIDGRAGFADGSGKLKISARFESTGMFSDGFAAVKFGGKWGYIKRDGTLLTSYAFDEAGPFSGGLAPVKTGGRYTFIHPDGALLSAFSFDAVGTPSDGLCPVAKGGKYALFHDGTAAVNTSPFIGASAWALPELNEAAEAGMTASVDASADYSLLVTRETLAELAMTFYELAGGAPPSGDIKNPFADTSNAAVIRAFGLGIVTGRSPTAYRPDDPVTREELCVILSRLVKTLGVTLKEGTPLSFSDGAKISPWAKSAVSEISGAGLVKGYSDGTFRPSAGTTIEQAVLVLYRLFTAEGVES
ncbi:WG repeat-containing protein [Oscillospiraceae bacterium OttesenSCG-928-G22]|nr:WG repeat-containing protein [Oscillospiraceae bacterium OttesenSCG-928-G22]